MSLRVKCIDEIESDECWIFESIKLILLIIIIKKINHNSDPKNIDNGIEFEQHVTGHHSECEAQSAVGLWSCDKPDDLAGAPGQLGSSLKKLDLSKLVVVICKSKLTFAFQSRGRHIQSCGGKEIQRHGGLEEKEM